MQPNYLYLESSSEFENETDEVEAPDAWGGEKNIIDEEDLNNWGMDEDFEDMGF